MASGNPSTRWQIAATAGAVSGVSEKRGSLASARRKECDRRGVLELIERWQPLEVWERQREERPLPLAAQGKGFPARGEHGEARACRQQLADSGRRQDLLAVIQQDEQLLVAQPGYQHVQDRPARRLVDAQGAGDRGHDERGVRDGVRSTK